MPSHHLLYHIRRWEREKAPEYEMNNDTWMGFGKKSSENSGGNYGSHDQQFQRNTWCKRLQRLGILLLAVAILHYIYRGRPFPVMVRRAAKHDSHPTLHFALAENWVGNPTGLFIDANKTWHMYFEYDPTTISPVDCKSWGHATSPDMYTWTMQLIALECDEYSIWGGSAVVGKNNTSGFFPNQTNGVVAFYTQYHLVDKTEEQAIAYSMDGGYTFTKYAKNPVLRFSEGNNQNFRGPKVIWHQPTQRWVMAVAKPASTAIGLYTSPNLIDWTSAPDFKNKDLAVAGHGFECPNLVLIPRINSTGAEDPNLPTVPGGEIDDFGDYILLGSSRGGSPLNGGSVTRYFPGKFNGTHFEPIDNRIDHFIDFGPDNYASQFFFGLPDRAPVVSLGLASNLQYTSSVPTRPREGWSGIATGPRESYLIHDLGEGSLSYFNRPTGLDALRDRLYADLSVQQMANQSVSYGSSEAVLVEARFETQPPNDNAVEINLDFIFTASSGPEQLPCTMVFRTWTADFGCDRSQATLNWTLSDPILNQMSAQQVRPLLPFHNPAVRRWEVQAIMDRSILEVYLNRGVKAGTLTMFPSSPLDTVRFQTNDMPVWASLKVRVQGLRAGRSVRLEL